MTRTRSTAMHWLATHIWSMTLVAIALVAAVELGALDWYTGDSITTADGTVHRLPNTFASIDHPFHISKERTVIDAVRDGEFPRWFANHQGGYPAEFYPLGADFVVAAAWGLGLGLVPLEVVHKLVIIAVLFIPAAAFWVIARRDGLPGSVAVVATLLHLFIPGSWMAGGPDELLRMGMWPNVFAAYLMLPLLIVASDYVRHGKLRGLVLSAGIGSLAVYTNPRASIAVGTVLLAIAIVMVVDRPSEVPRRAPASVEAWIRDRWTRRLASRLALVGFTIGLLSAALLVPLRAHQDDYAFIRFVEFDTPGKFVEYLGGAMPLEVVALGLAGIVIAWRGHGFLTRVVACWLPLGLTVVVIAGWALRDLSIFAQLEGPRLIPILRLPLLLLAAIAIHRIVATGVAVVRKEPAPGIASLISVALTVAFVLTPITTLATDERGLPAIETTNQPAFAAIAMSAASYERISTPLDRALIAGSPLSDHASFWIPALTDANAFHAAWIWYWKTPNYADRTRIADINATLDQRFLRRHALSYVLIATTELDLMNTALDRDHLELVAPALDSGYAIFRVTDAGASANGPVSMSEGEVTSVEVSREHLSASLVATQPTTVRIAINDFPAWAASVNHNPAAIRRDEDGYMLIDVPAGDVELELAYTIERAVWLGRTLTVVGFAVLVTAVFVERRGRSTCHPER